MWIKFSTNMFLVTVFVIFSFLILIEPISRYDLPILAPCIINEIILHLSKPRFFFRNWCGIHIKGEKVGVEYTIHWWNRVVAGKQEGKSWVLVLEKIRVLGVKKKKIGDRVWIERSKWEEQTLNEEQRRKEMWLIRQKFFFSNHLFYCFFCCWPGVNKIRGYVSDSGECCLLL